MGQKRSDLDTLPLCSAHHEEQHRIGWPRFIQTYELDVQEILRELRERPILVICHRSGDRYPSPVDAPAFYQAFYKDTEFTLLGTADGVAANIRLAWDLCGEYLRDQLRERHLKKTS